MNQIPSDRRGSERYQNKSGDFKNKLKSLFDISPVNVEDLFRSTKNDHWEEDYQFLINQRKVPQQGFMTGVVQQFVQRETRKRKRTEERSRQSKAIATAQLTQQALSDDDSASNLKDCQEEEEFTVPLAKSATQQLNVSRINLVKQTSQVVAARGLSCRDTTVVVASVINAGGRNINDSHISPTTTWRHNRNTKKEIAK